MADGADVVGLGNKKKKVSCVFFRITQIYRLWWWDFILWKKKIIVNILAIYLGMVSR